VLLTSGLLILLLALAVVPTVLQSGDDGRSGSPGGGAAPSGGSVSPAVAASSPEEYQQALATLDSTLADGMRKLNAARTAPTVRNAADALALAVDAETEKLRAITPPEAVAAAHDRLVTALEGFSAAVSSDSTEGVCSGSSATPRISRETAVNELRVAAQALGTADPAHAYRVGTSLPKVAKDPNRRMSNGRYLKRTASNGSGQLKIKNGGGTDSVISIVAGNAKLPTVAVYVRGKQSFTVRGVRDGTYHIYVTTGTDWDSAARTFSRDCSFARFDDAFKFSTTSTTYTVWELTVSAVAGGNATATEVGADEFPIG
jgi:hypothetical protein